jgi:hypothetical protein
MQGSSFNPQQHKKCEEKLVRQTMARRASHAERAARVRRESG